MILDGQSVDSCLMMAYQADGGDVQTIEGLAEAGRLHPLQDAFIEKGGVQCGICIPGMVLAAKAMLDRDPEPDAAAIRAGLAGNLCRCTGYTKIFEAVEEASGVGSLKIPATPLTPAAPGYFRPRTLDDALEILAQRSGEVAPDRRRHRRAGPGQGRHRAPAVGALRRVGRARAEGHPRGRRPRLDRGRHARTRR